MPNRYVRESAIESERVNALSWQAEVFFRRLINRADDFGRYTANLALLRASLFPLQLDKVSEADVKRLLEEVESCGLLATYQHDGKHFLLLARWEQGRAKESRYPSPSADVLQRLQTYVYTPRQMSAYVPDSDSDSDSDTDSDTDKSARPPSIVPAKASNQEFALVDSPKEKPSSPWEIKFDLELPENLRTQNCLDAVREWLKYKAERREGYKPTGLKASLTKWGNEFTPANFPQAIQNSMAAGWSGIFPPKPQGGPSQAQGGTSLNSSRPVWAIKKEIGQRLDRLEEQIGSHKANISSRNCIPDRITTEQEAELKVLRAQKAHLLKQLDALPIE